MSGRASLWNVKPDTTYSDFEYGPYAGWSAHGLATGPDNISRLLWDKTDGTFSLWALNNDTGTYTFQNYGPFPGWDCRRRLVGAVDARRGSRASGLRKRRQNAIIEIMACAGLLISPKTACKMTPKVKICPDCGTASELYQNACPKCGHGFRTQFNPYRTLCIPFQAHLMAPTNLPAKPVRSPYPWSKALLVAVCLGFALLLAAMLLSDTLG